MNLVAGSSHEVCNWICFQSYRNLH